MVNAFDPSREETNGPETMRTLSPNLNVCGFLFDGIQTTPWGPELSL
jgi:hypothetical protein